MIFFPIPFLQLSFPNDKEFAEALCKRVKESISEFQEIYCDELYFVASKFCNRGIPQKAWYYRTDTGYTIKVTDDVSDTYLWLVKSIVLNKSCHFRGDNGASFEAYIKTVLNSDFTFKDWLKWKTDDSLIKVPGATGYVPRSIEQLGQPCIDIYKLLRQKKSGDAIRIKLDIEYVDYLGFYDQIESCLIESNQIHLISAPRYEPTDTTWSGDDDVPKVQLSGEKDIGPEKSPEADTVKNLVKSILSKLDKAESKILILWGNGYSADEIMNELSTRPFLKEYKMKLNLEQSRDIYPLLERLMVRSIRIVEEHHPELQFDFKLDKKKMKRLLRTYFNYF